VIVDRDCKKAVSTLYRHRLTFVIWALLVFSVLCPVGQHGIDAATPTETSAWRSVANSPPTRIRIPKIRVDANVVEVGYEMRQENGRTVAVWKVADFAAGFHRGSAYPGRAGNTVIAGHNNIRGRVFRYLLNLQPGDEVYLYAGSQEFSYAVAQVLLLKEAGMSEEIQRGNAKWIEPTEDERLTLVGCWPFIKPDHRVVVIAHPSPGP